MGMAGILFGILFLSLFIGVPIAISLGVAASLTMMLTNNAQYLASIPTRMFTQLDSFTLMAVPFFILAGNIMAEGGISDRAAAQETAGTSVLYLCCCFWFLRSNLRI